MERAAAAKKEAEIRAKAEAAEKALLAEARKAAEQAALNNKSMDKKLKYYQDLLLTDISNAESYEAEMMIATLTAQIEEAAAIAKIAEDAHKALELEKKQKAAADKAAKLKAEKEAAAAKVKAEAEAAAAAKVKAAAEAAAREEAAAAKKAGEEAAYLEAVKMQDYYQEMLDSSTDLEDQLVWLDAMADNASLLFGAEEVKKEREAAEAILIAAAAEEARLEKERKQKEDADAARLLKQQMGSLEELEARIKENA